MKKILFIFLLVIFEICCSKSKTIIAVNDEVILKIKDNIKRGNYDEALKLAKDVSTRVPSGPETEDALYLEGYTFAYGKSDFQNSKLPLKQLLDAYPKGKYAAQAQKMLADDQYWQGHYHTAIKEYKKIESNYEDKDLKVYAEMQIGNCLLLDDKVGDALANYRELIERNPTNPISDSAQLMIANTYLKLQNLSQAKLELQKIMSFSRNKIIQQEAQKALRQIEEEEPLKKGVEIP